MRAVKRLALAIALLASTLVAAGCAGDSGSNSGVAANSERSASGGPATRACPRSWRADWQALSRRVGAPVYCPRWLPFGFTGNIRSSVSVSVDPDRSYLVTFLDQREGFEAHLTMRGYPGRTTIPACRLVQLKDGQNVETQVPCFAARRGTKRVPGITAAVYTVNRDADDGHVLYAWRYRGSLYTLAHHADHSMTPAIARRNLDRVLPSLALVMPQA